MSFSMRDAGAGMRARGGSSERVLHDVGFGD
jgi:hypothetical protein